MDDKSSEIKELVKPLFEAIVEVISNSKNNIFVTNENIQYDKSTENIQHDRDSFKITKNQKKLKERKKNRTDKYLPREYNTLYSHHSESLQAHNIYLQSILDDYNIEYDVFDTSDFDE